MAGGLPISFLVGMGAMFIRLFCAWRVALKFAAAEPGTRPRSVHTFFDDFDVEVASRIMRVFDAEGVPCDPAALDAAETVLKAGVAMYPNSVYLRIVYSNFLIDVRREWWGLGRRAEQEVQGRCAGARVRNSRRQVLAECRGRSAGCRRQACRKQLPCWACCASLQLLSVAVQQKAQRKRRPLHSPPRTRPSTPPDPQEHQPGLGAAGNCAQAGAQPELPVQHLLEGAGAQAARGRRRQRRAGAAARARWPAGYGSTCRQGGQHMQQAAPRACVLSMNPSCWS